MATGRENEGKRERRAKDKARGRSSHHSRLDFHPSKVRGPTQIFVNTLLHLYSCELEHCEHLQCSGKRKEGGTPLESFRTHRHTTSLSGLPHARPVSTSLFKFVPNGAYKSYLRKQVLDVCWSWEWECCFGPGVLRLRASTA